MPDNRYFKKIAALIEDKDLEHLFYMGNNFFSLHNSEGEDLLDYFEKHNDSEAIHTLVDAHLANIKIFSTEKKLIRASLISTHKKQINLFLSSGFDIANSLNNIEPGFNLLMDSVGENDTKKLEYYLSIGADIDQYAFTSQPLMLAVLWRHVECIKILCKNGANVNLPAGDNSFYRENKGLISPLELAKESKNKEIINILQGYS
ncbi:MAG: ankyrin repeat domain-containing protein [Candidatus Electrothrix sp. ATG2]|nr:ankyrin repeat domain-containing protein [Candidatus Electrothrix sp. ATG2]